MPQSDNNQNGVRKVWSVKYVYVDYVCRCICSLSAGIYPAQHVQHQSLAFISSEKPAKYLNPSLLQPIGFWVSTLWVQTRNFNKFIVLWFEILLCCLEVLNLCGKIVILGYIDRFWLNFIILMGKLCLLFWVPWYFIRYSQLNSDFHHLGLLCWLLFYNFVRRFIALVGFISTG